MTPAPEFYRPGQPVAGAAYGLWFKLLATALTIGLAAYGLHVGLRFPLLQYGFGVKALLLCAAAMLLLTYVWFLRSRTIVDEGGIRQTWIYDKRVQWRDVRGAKMIGVPYAGWLFPPRLVIRTGNSFTTFNGGTRALLVEFAKIALAFQMKR